MVAKILILLYRMEKGPILALDHLLLLFLFLLFPVLLLLLLVRHHHQLPVSMQLVNQFGCLMFDYLGIALEKLWRPKE